MGNAGCEHEKGLRVSQGAAAANGPPALQDGAAVEEQQASSLRVLKMKNDTAVPLVNTRGGYTPPLFSLITLLDEHHMPRHSHCVLTSSRSLLLTTSDDV